MKIKVVLSTIFCMFLLQTSFAISKVVKERGGVNGYNMIRETHNEGAHLLTCIDPGSAPCVWDIQPPAIVTPVSTYDVDDIVLQVESYIALGQFVGAYLLDGEIEVSWTALSYDTYEITIGTDI